MSCQTFHSQLVNYKQQLEKTLRESRFLRKDSFEEKQRILCGLDCPIKSMPLYHYSVIDKYSLRNLRNGQMTLTNPDCFNDAYDGLLHIDYDKIHESFVMVDKKFFMSQIQAARGGRPLKEGADEIVTKLFQQLAQHPDEELEKKIYPRYEELAKSAEDELKKMPSRMRGSIRVHCLSECPDSQLMWAHYADSGRGFCIEYNCPIDYSVTNYANDFGRNLTISLMPVIYSDKRYDATHIVEEHVRICLAEQLGIGQAFDYSTFDCLKFIKLALFKSRDWSCENEWRLFAYPFCNEQDRIYCPALQVKSVILGHLIDNGDRLDILDAVKQLIAKTRQNVVIRRIEVDNSSDSYQFRLVNDGVVEL